jgi:hypothetical protein
LLDLSPLPLMIVFPLLFAALWLSITAILALPSGWLRLMTRFPDQRAQPALRLSWQSGTMGAGVHIRGALILSVCSSGLRVGIMRLFGPFCRDFLCHGRASRLPGVRAYWGRWWIFNSAVPWWASYGSPAIAPTDWLPRPQGAGQKADSVSGRRPATTFAGCYRLGRSRRGSQLVR